MSEFFFNDLSIHNQFADKKAFLAALEMFKNVRTAVTGANHIFYVHRNILLRDACGVSFRKAVLMHCNVNQIKQVMSWVDKSANFLPDEETFLPSDRFECDGVDVSSSAIAECAYRCLIEGDVLLTSLNPSEYNKSPIKVIVNCSGDAECVELENLYKLPNLDKRISEIKAPIATWEVLIEQINALPSVDVSSNVIDQLAAEPFARNIAEECYRRARALSEMAQCKTIEAFNVLYVKYCTGDSWFSDSSDTEKKDFKSKLTFTVNGSKKLCPFHGKVKIRQFRIHTDKVASFGNDITIVYIGPKLTKV